MFALTHSSKLPEYKRLLRPSFLALLTTFLFLGESRKRSLIHVLSCPVCACSLAVTFYSNLPYEWPSRTRASEQNQTQPSINTLNVSRKRLTSLSIHKYSKVRKFTPTPIQGFIGFFYKTVASETPLPLQLMTSRRGNLGDQTERVEG